MNIQSRSNSQKSGKIKLVELIGFLKENPLNTIDV